MSHEFARTKAADTHRTNRAVEHLLGMVTGMVADAELNNKEIQLLRLWMISHPEATATFPGSVIQKKVAQILEDGIITEDERSHLLQTLTALAAGDFDATGSADAQIINLPIDDAVTIELKNTLICLTGEFLYGTRAACERLVLRAGAMCADNVSKKVDILIVGTRVSTEWAHTSFGRKIQRAVELQSQGHPIEIISERRMMDALVNRQTA